MMAVVHAEPLRVITGCSGAGVPTLVLKQILGGDDTVEEVACEIERAAAFALMNNATHLCLTFLLS
jgi:predicted ATPase